MADEVLMNIGLVLLIIFAPELVAAILPVLYGVINTYNDWVIRKVCPLIILAFIMLRIDS